MTSHRLWEFWCVENVQIHVDTWVSLGEYMHVSMQLRVHWVCTVLFWRQGHWPRRRQVDKIGLSVNMWCLLSLSPTLGLEVCTTCLCFLKQVLGIQLKSSFLQSKYVYPLNHFPDWAFLFLWSEVIINLKGSALKLMMLTWSCLLLRTKSNDQEERMTLPISYSKIRNNNKY